MQEEPKLSSEAFFGLLDNVSSEIDKSNTGPNTELNAEPAFSIYVKIHIRASAPKGGNILRSIIDNNAIINMIAKGTSADITTNTRCDNIDQAKQFIQVIRDAEQGRRKAPNEKLKEYYARIEGCPLMMLEEVIVTKNGISGFKFILNDYKCKIFYNGVVTSSPLLDLIYKTGGLIQAGRNNETPEWE